MGVRAPLTKIASPKFVYRLRYRYFRFKIPLRSNRPIRGCQASGWVEAEDYKMPPVLMHFYRLVTLDSFFGHCCFLIIFRSVCLQLIGLSEWEIANICRHFFY